MPRPTWAARLAAAAIAWAAPSAPAVADPVPPAAPAAPPPVQVRALVQSWYLFDETTPDTFKIRRLNVWVSGQVDPTFGYCLMLNPLRPLALPAVTVDPTKPGGASVASGGDDRILQDAYVRATWAGWTLQAGQFKLPVSAEALEAAADLVTARRALFNESATQIGFVRDLGVQLRGKPLPWLETTVGLFDGEAQNVADKNHEKDVVGRLGATPWPGLTLGLSHLAGSRGAAATPRRRTGANAEWAAGPWLLRAEALHGVDGPDEKLGWYGQAAWAFAERWQLVGRHERWNPTLAQGGASEERATTVALNWYLAAPSRIALNVVRHEAPAAAPDHTAIVVWQLTR